MFPMFSNSMTRKAGADVYACRFVKLSTSDVGAVIQGAAAADVCVGVSAQENFYPPSTPGATADLHAPSGYSCRFFPIGNEAVLELGTGGCTVGDTLCSDANGKGVVSSATAGKTFYAQALETGVAGDRVRVMVYPGVKTS